MGLLRVGRAVWLRVGLGLALGSDLGGCRVV